jgi:hypothetical protein
MDSLIRLFDPTVGISHPEDRKNGFIGDDARLGIGPMQTTRDGDKTPHWWTGTKGRGRRSELPPSGSPLLFNIQTDSETHPSTLNSRSLGSTQALRAFQGARCQGYEPLQLIAATPPPLFTQDIVQNA